MDILVYYCEKGLSEMGTNVRRIRITAFHFDTRSLSLASL
jgi:hypothetical protein